MPSARALLAVAGLALVGPLSSCTSFATGMGTSGTAALGGALHVRVDGFRPADAPAPPTAICRSLSGDPVPQVAGTLRHPVAVAFTDGRAELDAWAWRTSSSDEAAGIVDRAAAGSDACEQDLIADYDTDGDGQFDGGSQTITTAGRYDRSGWRGVAVRTERDGYPTTVTRYAQMDDVVVLVTVTDGGDDADATVDGYLEAVGAAL